jgi:hypothetical protein
MQFDANNSYVTVMRGTFSGPAKSNNQACLFFDNMPYVSVIGALVIGSACPIYFKHNPGSAQTSLVKNCILRNAGRDFEAQRDNVLYQNNVFDSCQLSLDAAGGGALASGCTLIHNTFNNSIISNSQGSAATNMVLTNNVLAGTSSFYDNAYSATDEGDIINYSAVNGTGTTHYQRNHTGYTMAAYKAAYPTQEVNGLAGTVTFAGGSAGGGSAAAGWALASGSIGIGNASDGSDRGVNASTLLTVY